MDTVVDGGETREESSVRQRQRNASTSTSTPPRRIKTVTAGWLELERALRTVYASVMAELKPLGVVGMATFDPMAGFVLWNEQREAERNKARGLRELYPNGEVDGGRVNPTIHAPDVEALRAVRVAVKYAIGAYGTASSVLSDASFREKLKSLKTHAAASGATAKDYERMHALASEACAKSCEIDAGDVIDADWNGTEFSPSSFVAIDRAEGKVALSVRGTWELHDALTDVNSESVEFLGGWAHAGMVASAWQVAKRMIPAVAAALAKNPSFEFLVTGHSMGGGVAACIAMLMHSTDSDIEKLALEGLGGEFDEDAKREVLTRLAACKCVCIAAPSVSSMDLSEKASDYITCVVAGADVVPRLCHASVRRLLRRLNHAAPSHAMLRAVSSVLGGRDRPSSKHDLTAVTTDEDDDEDEDEDKAAAETPSTSPSKPTAEEFKPTSARKKKGSKRTCQGDWNDLEDVVGLELRDHSAMDFMVQPGRVIHLKHVRSNAPTAEYKHPTAFTDVLLDPYMMLDHIPGTYQAAVKTIHDRVKAGGSAWIQHEELDRESDEEDEEDAVSALLHDERVRARARRGWRSVRNFLGFEDADDEDDEDEDQYAEDDDKATNVTTRAHRCERTSAALTALSNLDVRAVADTDEDEDEIPNYYGEHRHALEHRHARPATTSHPPSTTTTPNIEADDRATGARTKNPFADAWTWLNS